MLGFWVIGLRRFGLRDWEILRKESDEKLERGEEVKGGPGRVEKCGEVRAGAAGRVAPGLFFLSALSGLTTKDNMALAIRGRSHVGHYLGQKLIVMVKNFSLESITIQHNL